MAQLKNTSQPATRSPNAGGLPHPNRDAMDSDSGARPATPKTAGGAEEQSTSPLDSKVANRNAGRKREAGTTPRPTDKPLD